MQVINISQIRKAAGQSEYQKELDKREKCKQKLIETVISRLNDIEIDTMTMTMALNDIKGVF